jgi:hypothetical protein
MSAVWSTLHANLCAFYAKPGILDLSPVEPGSSTSRGWGGSLLHWPAALFSYCMKIFTGLKAYSFRCIHIQYHFIDQPIALRCC